MINFTVYMVNTNLAGAVIRN